MYRGAMRALPLEALLTHDKGIKTMCVHITSTHTTKHILTESHIFSHAEKLDVCMCVCV